MFTGVMTIIAVSFIGGAVYNFFIKPSNGSAIWFLMVLALGGGMIYVAQPPVSLLLGSIIGSIIGIVMLVVIATIKKAKAR